MKLSIIELALELSQEMQVPAIVDPRHLDWLDREELVFCLSVLAPHISVAPHGHFH